MKLVELQMIIESAALAAFDLPEIPAFEASYVNSEFGDFSTNISFKLAGLLKMSPKQIAQKLVHELSDERLSKVEVAGAGYINMTASDQVWKDLLKSVNKDFGSSKYGAGQKVQVEFISANPTGPTTFGNARGGFIGDTVARVLRSQGYDVTSEYYFNDAGTQISKLVESVKVAAGLIEAEDVQYKGQYIEELAEEFKAELKDATDQQAATILTTAIVKRYIEPAIGKMNVHFDIWFNEKSLGPDGKVKAAFAALEAKDLIYESDGAQWLASSKLGDERDRVLVKSSGDLTYLANDIAYHLDIFTGRGFDRAIKDWGADHVGQVPSLSLVMKALVPDAELDFILHQWVRLMKDGHEVKMSKRAGSYVTVEEVVDIVGSDVARFFFLMRSADSQLDFDLGLAEEQSQNNPLYYVMYAYVRAKSILGKAKLAGLQPLVGESLALGHEQREVVKLMARWPELLGELSNSYTVHKLTHYGIEVATAFQKYYEAGQILTLPKAEASNQLYFLVKYCEFMDSYWSVLGIQPQEKMIREQPLES